MALEQDTATLDEPQIDTAQPADDADDDFPSAGQQASQVAGEQTPGDGSNPGAETEFSADASALAEQYGLNPSNFRDERSLYDAVAVIDRQLNQWQRQLRGEGKQPPAATPAASPQTAALQKLDIALKALEGEDFDERVSGWSKGVVQALQQLSEYVHTNLDGHSKRFGEFDPIKQKVEQLEGFVSQQHQERFVSDMDRRFANLGDEFKATFGDKPWQELSPAERQQRNVVVEQMNELFALDQALGRQRSGDTIFKLALQMTHGQNHQAIARKQITSQLAGRKNSALAKGNAKNAAPASSKARAVAAIAAKLKEFGGQGADDDDDE